MTYLERAQKDGHAKLAGEGKQQKITYIAVNHSERYADPEEVVRAEFWAELIYRYGYEPARIGVEVVVPDRTPSDRADLVVFHDDVRKKPYTVIKCKKDGVPDAEFSQAVEQVSGNGTWAKFRADYVMVVAGATRRALDVTEASVKEYGILERERNIIADLPRQYGKPEEFKYTKGGSLDIPTGEQRSVDPCDPKMPSNLMGRRPAVATDRVRRVEQDHLR
jgi:type I restriction enzyme M protein